MALVGVKCGYAIGSASPDLICGFWLSLLCTDLLYVSPMGFKLEAEELFGDHDLVGIHTSPMKPHSTRSTSILETKCES